MATFTSYTIDNDKAFRKAIDAAKRASGDLRIPFGLVSKDFYRSQKAIWQLKGPGQYPDLKPKTKTRKLRKFGFVYPILKETGVLEKSMTSPRGKGALHSITKEELIMGTSVEYGAFHQSDEPRSKLPLRKFLFIGPEAPRFANSDQAGRLNRWVNIVEDYVIQISKKAGIGG